MSSDQFRTDSPYLPTYSATEVAGILRVKRADIWNWDAEGVFPPGSMIQVATGHVRYTEAAVRFGMNRLLADMEAALTRRRGPG